jgi:hypothetical protein
MGVRSASLSLLGNTSAPRYDQGSACDNCYQAISMVRPPGTLFDLQQGHHSFLITASLNILTWTARRAIFFTRWQHNNCCVSSNYLYRPAAVTCSFQTVGSSAWPKLFVDTATQLSKINILHPTLPLTSQHPFTTCHCVRFLLNCTGRPIVRALILCKMSTEGAMAHQYQVLEELGEFP